MPTILFKHPHRGDTVEVEDTPEAMSRVMIRGYVQVSGRQTEAGSHPSEAEAPAEGHE